MSQFVLKQRGRKEQEFLAMQAFVPGMKLYGYCCGIFGRDSYGVKTIVRIYDEVLTVREESGSIKFGRVSKPFTWIDLLESSNRDCEDPDYLD